MAVNTPLCRRRGSKFISSYIPSCHSMAQGMLAQKQVLAGKMIAVTPCMSLPKPSHDLACLLGEELTFDYSSVTESEKEFRDAICLCSTATCRQALWAVQQSGIH